MYTLEADFGKGFEIVRESNDLQDIIGQFNMLTRDHIPARIWNEYTV